MKIDKINPKIFFKNFSDEIPREKNDIAVSNSDGSVSKESIKRFGALGAITLGLVTLVQSANAGEKQASEKPPSVEARHSQVIDQIKSLLEKKIELPKDVLDEFINTHSSNAYYNRNLILKGVSQDLRVKITNKVFKAHIKALKENSTELDWRENWSWDLLYALSMGTEERADLKTILEKNKNEYKELVETYVNVLANSEKITTPGELRKRASMFNNILLLKVQAVAPSKLFDEKWYPNIEKIIANIDKDLKSEGPVYLDLLVGLSALEQRKENGIKEPRIYPGLLKIAGKSTDNFYTLTGHLQRCITNEAVINDNPKGSRLLEGTADYLSRIKVDESLIQPYEKLLQKALSAVPGPNATEEENNKYNGIWYVGRQLASNPFYRNTCLMTMQDIALSKLPKAQPEDILTMLSQAQSKFELSSFTNTQNYEKVVEASRPYLKPALETGFKYLLDEDSKKNQVGADILLSVKNYYPSNATFSLKKDFALDKTFEQVLNRFQKTELKDEQAIKAYIDVLANLQKDGLQNIQNLKSFNSGLKQQLDFTFKAKQNAINGVQINIVHKREHELLKGINQLMDYLNGGTAKYTERIEHAESVFKTVHDKAVKDSFNYGALDEARKLVISVQYYSTSSKDEDKECKRFYKETVIPLFKGVLESSNNLPRDDRESLQNQIYSDMLSFFRFPTEKEGDYGNIFVLNETLQSISKNFFNLKNDKGLDQFIRFTNAAFESNDESKNWRMPMMVKILHTNNEYLNDVLKKTNGLLDSNKETSQHEALDQLITYKTFLTKIQSKFKDESIKRFCTKEESEVSDELTKTHIKGVNDSILNNLNTVKVITKRSSNKLEHSIYDDVFKLNIKALEELVSGDVNIRKKCLGIIDDRLINESDPKTRGMLYVAMIRLSNDEAQVLKSLKKAMVLENSPLTLQYIGKELGTRFLTELPEYKKLKDSPEDSYNEHEGGGQSARNGYVSEFAEKISAYNKRLNTFIKGDDIKLDEKTPIYNFLLDTVGTSRGRDLETLLKENLSEDLAQKLKARKQGDEVDPAIIKAALRTLSNANNIISGFQQKISYPLIKEEHFLWLDSNDSEGKLSKELNTFNTAMVSVLENNLRWSGIKNVPHVVAALVIAYGQNESTDEYNKKIESLSQRLFKSTDERQSMSELYEGGLQNRFLWKYLENHRNKNGNDKYVEEECKTLFKQMNEIDKMTTAKGRERARYDLSNKLRDLDLKLYGEIIREPLNNFKLRFIEEFIAFAPSGQRKEYIDTVLSTFGLRSQVSELDLRRTLGLDEE